MDSKRSDKYCSLKHLCYILAVLLLSSCTWVKDENDDCPYGFWLNLHYTRNMLDVDAAAKCISEVSVFIYDSEGNFVSRVDVPQSTLAANKHRVRIEGLEEGDYQFVVWGGLSGRQYGLWGDKDKMDEFRLAVENSGATVSSRLQDLYYGYLKTVHYNDSYATHDVYMMKDTNQLACLVVQLSSDDPLSPDDYDMKLVSANGEMDIENDLVADKETTYMPFEKSSVTIDDIEYGKLQGVKYNLNTLRLMQDTDCRLILEKKDTGEKVFDISLPEYIGMLGSLYGNDGSPMPVQEYLDRQDFYTVVFVLSEDLNQLIQFQVNSWRLRAKNHLKL